MKKKHIIALVCVLALAASLMSSFAFAAVAETEVQPRAHVFRVVRDTHLFKQPGEGYCWGDLPANSIVYQESTTITNGYDNVRATINGVSRVGFVHGKYLSGIS